MRRVLTLSLYTAMVVGGLYLLKGVYDYGGRTFLVLVGGALVIFGAYLIWMDFLAPAHKRDQPSPIVPARAKSSSAEANARFAWIGSQSSVFRSDD